MYYFNNSCKLEQKTIHILPSSSNSCKSLFLALWVTSDTIKTRPSLSPPPSMASRFVRLLIDNKDHKRCDFTHANVCEKCTNSTAYYANTHNMHKKVLLSHTRESDRSMVATGKIVMLTCTSAFYKIRCSFGSNQFLSYSALLNNFFADIVNNK